MHRREPQGNIFRVTRRATAFVLALIALAGVGSGCAPRPETQAVPKPSSTVATLAPTTTTTTIPAALVDVMDGAGMTVRARELFLSASPQLEDAPTLSRSCSVVENPDQLETAHTFGCFINGVIHVRVFKAPEVASLTYAVAAHELLHVVYARLTSSDRASLDLSLSAQRSATPLLEERLQVYAVRSEDTLNEVHSVLGTEFADLSSPLEAHYGQYFDRARVLDAYNRALGNREAEIRSLKARIDQTGTRLTALDAELSALKDANDIRGYNAQIAVYNSVVADHNAAIDTLKDRVDEYARLTAS